MLLPGLHKVRVKEDGLAHWLLALAFGFLPVALALALALAGWQGKLTVG